MDQSCCGGGVQGQLDRAADRGEHGVSASGENAVAGDRQLLRGDADRLGRDRAALGHQRGFRPRCENVRDDIQSATFHRKIAVVSDGKLRAGLQSNDLAAHGDGRPVGDRQRYW